MAKVVSVNTGRGVDAQWAGGLKRTAIDKRPAGGPGAVPVRVGRLGLAGDEQADTEHHGGPEQAVYAYAREDLDWWVEQLGRELPNGTFGENVTTHRLDVTGALIGERWRLGSAVVEVTGPRIPCVVFQNWLGEDHWVRRFSAAARPGAYLRVTQDGSVTSGDRIEVLHRPAGSVTVAESMRAYYGDATLLRRLLQVPGRGPQWDEVARRVLRPPGDRASGTRGRTGATAAGS
jgi:MOSC domain-containing protein YiiM